MAMMTATVMMMNTKTTLAVAAAAAQWRRQQQQHNGSGGSAMVAAAQRWRRRQHGNGSGDGGSMEVTAAAWQRREQHGSGGVAGSKAAALRGQQNCFSAGWWQRQHCYLMGGVFLWLRHFWQFGRPCITSENGRLLLKNKFPHKKHTKNPVWYLNGYLFHVCIFCQLSISCVNISAAT